MDEAVVGQWNWKAGVFEVQEQAIDELDIGLTGEEVTQRWEKEMGM